jgi:hypothetical protein
VALGDFVVALTSLFSVKLPGIEQGGHGGKPTSRVSVNTIIVVSI